MPGLLNPNLKMSGAKVHLDALDKQITDYRSKPSEFHRISSYDDLQFGVFVIDLESLNEESAFVLGLIAGDFICNLRSALDYVAWQLANLTTKSPGRRICFPIEGENTLDAQLKITKSTHGIPEEAIAIMKSLQPYHSGEAYKSTHLWRLHELWNSDKHRVMSFGAAISGEFLRIPSNFKVESTTLDNGTRVTFPLAAKQYMQFDPRPGVDFRFGNEKDGTIVTINDLREMYDFVSMEVIPKFARFFTERKVIG
jgi:hypothetical protein